MHQNTHFTQVFSWGGDFCGNGDACDCCGGGGSGGGGFVLLIVVKVFVGVAINANDWHVGRTNIYD